jgi:hypothetical protein
MDPLDVLNKVDAFYNSAWEKLIFFAGILVAMVGIIIPILFNWLQNRTLRIHESTIKNELENDFAKKLKEVEKTLTESVETKMSEKLKGIEFNIEIKNQIAQGGIFLLQGARNFRDGIFKQAVLDYCNSGTCYLHANDLITLLRINKAIPVTIAKLSKADLASLQEEEDQPNKYIAELKEKNEKGLFSDILKEIQREVAKIQNS